MTTIDSSRATEVGRKWVLPERGSDRAIRIRVEFARRVREQIAPDIVPIDVAHPLARTERRGPILPGEGAKKRPDIPAFLPDLHADSPLLPRAFGIASAARIGVYDGLYVALAEREGCKRITSDIRLVNALRATSRSSRICRPRHGPVFFGQLMVAETDPCRVSNKSTCHPPPPFSRPLTFLAASPFSSSISSWSDNLCEHRPFLVEQNGGNDTTIAKPERRVQRNSVCL